MTPLCSFVVPIYNDAELAGDFCEEFQRVFQAYLAQPHLRGHVELIFVNDGSRQESAFTLKSLCDRFEFLKVVNLSRNFGQHIALSCGYREARGAYVGMLNVDMQDPPDQIPLLLDFIRTGEYDIVFGLRNEVHASRLTRLTSRVFHKALSKLTGYEMRSNTSTLRLMNRRFVDAYNSLTESSRYLPGLEFWIGFRRGYVNIAHRARMKGRSSYDFTRRFALALDSIISFSDIPLKLAVLVGSVVAFVGLFLTLVLIIQKLFFIEMRPGYTSTVSVTVFLGGVQILFIGLASLYIGRILKEVQRRPLYIVGDRYPQETQRGEGAGEC
jgi:glycosyltransferase involved in cell wall biosynthesis